MANSKKEIMEKVESGEFFAEARDWYLRRYLYYFIERSYLIVLTLGLGFLLFLTLSYYNAILPISKDIPVQVNITDAAEQYTRITYLGNKKKDFNINHVLVKYLSKRFTEAFESYDYKDNFKRLQINKNMIESLGTAGIKSFYLEKTSFRNRDSLVLKYRRSVVREIFVDDKSIRLIENVNDEIDEAIKDYTVKVKFTVREIKEGKDVELSNWEAEINLYFEQIYYDFDEQEFNDLNFKVYGYESTKIE